MARLKVTEQTIKKLYAKSGNQCAFPGCSKEFFPENNTENNSNICHIEAAKQGGERYNQESNDEYRKSYENLIVLCPTHHVVTNDVNRYPVEKLRKMKKEHEMRVNQNRISSNPTILLDAINAIAETDFDDENIERDQEPFPIQAKMDYNSVKRWELYITEYKVYESKIDSIYSQLEQNGESFKKHKLLTIIRHTYLEILGEYKQEIAQASVSEIVRANSDDILDKVQKKLVEKSKINSDNYDIAVPIIMVNAFMRCKILEKPPSEYQR